jgi:hypothetical protein
MRIVCTFILVALLSGCSHRQTAQVSDVTKPETIVLKPSPTQVATNMTRINLRFHGKLDGDATITWKHHDPVSLTGEFDAKTGGSDFSGSCQLDYFPGSVRSGMVIIEYEFYQ